MFEPVAPGLGRLGILFVNVFALGEPGRPWLLLDAGLAGSAGLIRRAVAGRFGAGARPEGIVLTHGHFDHVGAARDLAEGWDVPLFAHPLEAPYLTGRSDYPPRDPTMGGAIAQMSRLMPDRGYDFSGRLRELPADGSLPGLAGWRWLHMPGHTPGHVSLYREADGVLLAADAFATMNLDSWTAYLTREREFSRPSPPSPSTGAPPGGASRSSPTWSPGWWPQGTASRWAVSRSHTGCASSPQASPRRAEAGTSQGRPSPARMASRGCRRPSRIRTRGGPGH